MKKGIIAIIVLSLFISCFKYGDSYHGVSNMRLYSVINTKTSRHSQIEGWFHSEFQSGLLNLSMEFSNYIRKEPGYPPKNEYYDNYPDENSIIITCSSDIWSANEDMIKAGQPLNDCFSITKFEDERKFYIYGFLISEREDNTYNFTERQYYTFFATIKTDKNELFADSCIVKRF